jgi:hypothetical protein
MYMPPVLKRCPLAPFILITTSFFLATIPPGRAPASPPEDLISSLTQTLSRQSGLRAVVTETEGFGQNERITTYILTASFEHGWRIDGATPQTTFTILNDLETDVRLSGQTTDVPILRATNPDLQRMFALPLTQLRPLELIPPAQLVYKTTDTMDQQLVHRFSGSIWTEVLDGEEPIRRDIEFWIAQKDGLLRRIVDSVDGQITIRDYQSVEASPPLQPSQFQWTPTPDFRAIDMNARLDSSTPEPAPQIDPKAPNSDSTNGASDSPPTIE